MSNNQIDIETEEYNNLTQKYYNEAKEKISNLEKSKKQVVKELAEKLEGTGMPIEFICSEICRNLTGYVNEDYIRDCLDEKYKEKKKQPIELVIGGNQQTEIEESPRTISSTNTRPTLANEAKKVTEHSSIDKDLGINEIVSIKLGMNDAKDLKKVLNKINLMQGIEFIYDLKTKKIVTIK
jgi:hypothetical protein